MAGKLYVLGEMDFDAMDRDLSALRPKKVGLETVLGRLRGRLANQLKRGVTVGQMREVLKSYGVSVSETRLREFIDSARPNEETGRTGVGDDSGPARGADGGGDAGEAAGEGGEGGRAVRNGES